VVNLERKLLITYSEKSTIEQLIGNIAEIGGTLLVIGKVEL